MASTTYDNDIKDPKAHDLGLTKVSTLDENASSIDDDDRVLEGSEGVTNRDMATLRQVSDSIPFASFLVIVAEFAERWTYYGTTNVYNNYIRFPMPKGSVDGSVPKADRAEGVAGALGLGVQTSFALRTFNTFWVYFTPWIGGILADTTLGRFNTILYFSIVCFLGHIVLVASATPASLAKPEVSLGLLALSIVIMGLGAGAIKANVSPMIAEQYSGKLRKTTLKSGEVVIISPAVTTQRMYMWFYCGINFGSTGAISASFLARDNGYWACYLVPTLIFALVPGVLLVFKKRYIKTAPRGSILLETFRVLKMCIGPAFSLNPVRFYKNCKADGFWEPAKPSYYPTAGAPTTITWDDTFVSEVYRTVHACGVFLFFPLFNLCYSQIDGNYGTMAGAMTLNGTPNDLIQNLNPISIIILIPIFDFVIYPALRRAKIPFTPIKRIAFGFIVISLAMTYAAVLQHNINQTNPCAANGFADTDGLNEPSACEHPDDGSADGGKPWHSPLNVWIIAGPYILVGIAEIFANITALEYAYSKAPYRMKSVVMAFYQFQSCIASAINFALVSVNVEPDFLWLFVSFAIVAFLSGIAFYLTFRADDQREVLLNAIGKGDRAGFKDERDTSSSTEKA